MSDQANVAVVMSVYEAFSRGDIAAVLGHMDSQADLIFEGPSEVPWTGNRHGHDGWGKFFQVVGENLDDVKLKNMEAFAVQGDNVVVAGRYEARVKSTGKRIDSPLVHLWTVRNGKVTRCHELTNTAAEAAACKA